MVDLTVLLLVLPFISQCLSQEFIATSVAVCKDNQQKIIAYVNTTQCPSNAPPLAFAVADNKINATGWAHLEIHTSDMYSNIEQAYAAGISEGFTTSELIYNHWMNTVAGYCKGVGDYCNRLEVFLIDNLKYMKAKIAAHKDDPYWHQVSLVLVQLAGMSDGYMDTISVPHMQIDPLQFLFFQLSGDLEDLEQALNKPKEFRKKVLGSGSCSAFIKLLPNNADLVFAHDTWAPYQTMLRILKKYAFKFHQTTAISSALIPGEVISFSSYPGTLPSIDDFYLTSNKLAITETTIGNNNSSRLSYISPSSVLTWIRSQVSNRLASNGQEWTNIFKKFSSGTYNNQWMIVDYKNFQPGKALPNKGLFYVLEQLPGLIISKDMTPFLLQNQYWPSYNVPYFPQIFNESNSWANVRKYGDWFTYDKTPRALIFKRDWKNVYDMHSLTTLMRYNNFKQDPLSRCNCTPPYSGENAISARCDLNPKNGTYPFASLGHRDHGGTDMKATNSHMIDGLKFIAISGPTYDQLTPFQWSKADFANTTPHLGHPDLWKFQPITVQWKY